MNDSTSKLTNHARVHKRMVSNFRNASEEQAILENQS